MNVDGAIEEHSARHLEHNRDRKVYTTKLRDSTTQKHFVPLFIAQSKCLSPKFCCFASPRNTRSAIDEQVVPEQHSDDSASFNKVRNSLKLSKNKLMMKQVSSKKRRWCPLQEEPHEPECKSESFDI